eukprot:9946150-Alexandrium_andersonii.AAC.1
MAPHAGPSPACDRRGRCLVRHCTGCRERQSHCREGAGPPRDAAGDQSRCCRAPCRSVGRDPAA